MYVGLYYNDRMIIKKKKSLKVLNDSNETACT